jgi:predicted metal-binding membrane protein
MSTRERTRLRNRVLVISGAAWGLQLLQPTGSLHCPVIASGTLPWRSSVGMLLEMNPLGSLAAGWMLMLVAMMSPLLIAPIVHIRRQSFRARGARSVALFVAGYAGVWLAAGALLVAVTLLAGLFMRQPLSAVVGAAVAVTWQFSPAKQYCLNRGHAPVALAAFGVAADRDAFRFGVSHAIWCAGSCWALMMAPMLLPQGHLAAMAAVSFLIFSERLEHPAVPRWSWRISGKLLRLLVAQTRIRLQTARFASFATLQS